MISLHTNWFLSEHQFEGLKKFLKWTTEENDDVFYGTATELLLWMTEPIEPNAMPPSLELERDPPCNNPTTCELPHTEKNDIKTIRYMRTCSECPFKYPWVKDPNSADNDEDEEDEEDED